MSSKRYPEEFKIEAVKQVTERGHSAPDVAKRLGVSQPMLYEWIRRYSLPAADRIEQQGQAAKIRRPKMELKRITEERDILQGRQRIVPTTSGVRHCVGQCARNKYRRAKLENPVPSDQACAFLRARQV